MFLIHHCWTLGSCPGPPAINGWLSLIDTHKEHPLPICDEISAWSLTAFQNGRLLQLPALITLLTRFISIRTRSRMIFSQTQQDVVVSFQPSVLYQSCNIMLQPGRITAMLKHSANSHCLISFSHRASRTTRTHWTNRPHRTHGFHRTHGSHGSHRFLSGCRGQRCCCIQRCCIRGSECRCVSLGCAQHPCPCGRCCNPGSCCSSPSLNPNPKRKPKPKPCLWRPVPAIPPSAEGTIPQKRLLLLVNFPQQSTVQYVSHSMWLCFTLR